MEHAGIRRESQRGMPLLKMPGLFLEERRTYLGTPHLLPSVPFVVYAIIFLLCSFCFLDALSHLGRKTFLLDSNRKGVKVFARLSKGEGGYSLYPTQGTGMLGSLSSWVNNLLPRMLLKV